MTLDGSPLIWRKSSYSGGAGGNCVEAARLPSGGMALRDSKHPEDAVLHFTRDAWTAFRKALCDGGLF
ncbi:DUF397 domain-containing protein [Thermobifida alba]|uniref:DUF397 domain-containing protein n=1 Tax=Thermobifida alba TaxID=53522 RepID=A0ABY4L3F1_THEAE|nr:DUF397 domain-containing protein [Thermobifida alba]UPT22181.1 DUF397 domain-containing protein [Thermobifida alba]